MNVGGAAHAASAHHWDCPVVMKLEPERVAWTCRSCGAIAKTDDPAVQPG